MATTLELMNAAQLAFLQNPPLFIVRQVNPQTIANNTNTNIAWDTPDTDTYNGFNAGVDNTKYVAQVAGYYDAKYVVCWAPNTTTHRAVYLQRNGSQVAGSWNNFQPADGAATCAGTFTVFLAVGDFLQVAVQQTSGGSLATANPGVGSPWWSLRWSHA